MSQPHYTKDCAQYSELWQRDDCYYTFAKEKGDSAYCKYISDNRFVNHCIGLIAQQLNNIEICKQISHNLDFERCLWRVIESSQQPELCLHLNDPFEQVHCISSLAQQTGNLTLCSFSEMVSYNMKFSCLFETIGNLQSPHLCLSLPTVIEKDQCIFSYALQNFKPESCHKISTPLTKSNCLNMLSNNKINKYSTILDKLKLCKQFHDNIFSLESCQQYAIGYGKIYAASTQSKVLIKSIVGEVNKNNTLASITTLISLVNNKEKLFISNMKLTLISNDIIYGPFEYNENNSLDSLIDVDIVKGDSNLFLDENEQHAIRIKLNNPFFKVETPRKIIYILLTLEDQFETVVKGAIPTFAQNSRVVIYP